MNDLRLALRSLRRRPGLTTALIVTVALGIGATTAIFTVMDAALIRPLPYREPGRLVHLWETCQTHCRGRASYPDLEDWRNQASAFEELEGYDGTNVTVTGSSTTAMLPGARVTAGFFGMLGVEPALGRTFLPGEDGPGGSPLAILAYGYWHRAFGSDPTVVGRSITIDRRPYRIIGVLPRTFQFAPAGAADLWLPVDRSAATRDARGAHWLSVVGRLRAGATPAAARRQLESIMGRLAASYPKTNAGRSIAVVPIRDQIAGNIRPTLAALFAAVTILLLIACANVASLLLARALGREREMALRIAMGASRWRVARQLLTESLLVAAAGAALGFELAQGAVRLLLAAVPTGLRAGHLLFLRDARPDARVLAFTMVLALVTGVAFGLAPALTASHVRGGSLMGSARATEGRAHGTIRDWLVIAEVALTVVLLVGVGIVGRSLLKLLREDPGFSVEHRLTVRVALSGPRYQSPSAQQRFFQDLLERVRVVPGVLDVGAVTQPPLGGTRSGAFLVEGRPEPDQEPVATLRGVLGDYFRTIGIPLIAGRAFTSRDDSTAPQVIVINRSLATRYFGSAAAALGHRLAINGYPLNQHPHRAWQIIGVVGDVKTGRLDAAAPLTIYWPDLQAAENRFSLVIRTSGKPPAMAGAVRAQVGALDPDVAVYGVSTLEDAMMNSAAVFARRFPLLLIAVFAGAALLLAAVGVYGVVAYTVVQRAKELGIRAALGATRRELLHLVLRHAAALGLGAAAVGIVLSFMFGQLLGALLYRVRVSDPATYLAAMGVLACVTIIASAVPAYKAAQADPMEALRHE